MRYMAKILKTSLIARFPEAAEKDILKVFIIIIQREFITTFRL